MQRRFGGIFDYETKHDRLVEVLRELENDKIWGDPEKAQNLNKEKVQLTAVLTSLDTMRLQLTDLDVLLEMAYAEDDEAAMNAVAADVVESERAVKDLEFQRMFSGSTDANNAFLEIQSGSGGTEAQDWAEMLLRMYLRWGERHGFKVELLEASAGDVAGLRGATVKLEGPYAYGWLRTETGVHRLVRKSPFDSGNRRHTSFAAVFVSAEIDDDIEVDINPADLRIDTYRAGGAGGQHVNKTDSAIRITHIPTGIVVQCQSDRSQHKNRSQAMKQLRSKMYDRQMQARHEEKQAMEESKTEIGWGNQIRSYVLDASRIKDLRTGVEVGNTQAVLDGDIDVFIEASLKEQV